MPTPPRTRPALTVWPAIFFLVGFAVLVALVSNYYLLPALAAAQSATQPARARLRAEAALLLAVLLIVLLSGLFLTFKVHRFFLPRPWRPQARTKHVDAWAEAGRRAGGADE